MAGLGAALRGEVYRALRSPVTRGIIVLVALATAARVGYEKFETLVVTARRDLGGGEGEALSQNAFGPLVDGLSAGLILAGILLLALAAGSLARDRDHGITRLFLTRRSSRGALVLAKLSALVVFGLILVGVVLLAAWGTAAVLYDFGPIVVEGYEMYPASEVQHEILLGLATAVVPLLASIAFGILLSISTRSAVQAVATALIALPLFDLFQGLLGGASRWIFASYLPGLSGRSYLQGDTWKVARGFSDTTFTNEDILLNLTVPAVETVFFMGLAFLVAARRRM